MTRRTRGMLAAFLVAALAVAGVVSAFASDAPDGLTAVSEDQGFASLEDEHDAADSPFTGYETEGVDDDGLSPALAGVVGVGVTFLLGGGLFLLVRGRSQPPSSVGGPPDDPDHGTARGGG